MNNKIIITLSLLLVTTLAATTAVVATTITTTVVVYAQTTTTPTQDDIDGDGMRNNNDQNDDNDGKVDWLDDDDDNDNIADSVDPILNTPGQQAAAAPASPPPTTTTTTPPQTTTTTPPSTEQKVIIDRPTAARLAAEDPYFARFEQILEQCQGLAFGESTIPISQCAQSMQEGADRWCGLEFYDALKCEYASFMAKTFANMNRTLAPFGPNAEELFEGFFAENPAIGEALRGGGGNTAP